MKNKLKKINYPLLLGVIILIYLFMMSLYPQKFTKRDPVYEENPRYMEVEIDGVKTDKFMTPPLSPNEVNIFGTDDAGRDVYARLVYGTKNTMKLALLIALLRMAIALPLGVSAGMGSKVLSNFIKGFNTFFTAIPMLIFSYVILNIGYFKSMQIDESIIAFAIILTIVGWAKLAGIIEDSTKLVMEEDFIEGEVAIGKTKAQIAFQNVIPHIIPGTISLIFKEMGLALFLVAQLAVFNVFVGVTRQISTLAFRSNYFMNLEPEWGGSLSRISQNVKGFESTYWMVVFPVIAFTVAIIGFNLTGEGLRIEFQKKDSRIISSIKKITYALSPKVFISQVKNFKNYYKPVIIKISAALLLVAYMVIPWHPSKYDFNIDEARGHLEELTSSKYEGRAAGTEGGKLAGDYIIEQLKAYGYEVAIDEIPLQGDPNVNPVTGSISISDNNLLVPMVIEKGWIRLVDKNGEEKTYNLHEDFTIVTVSESLYQTPEAAELNYKGIAADSERAREVDENTDFFYISRHLEGYWWGAGSTSNVADVVGEKGRNYDVKFMLSEGEKAKYNPSLFKYTTIIPYGELYEELHGGYKELEINFDYPKPVEHPGRNITAFLPTEGKSAQDPGTMVIIGAAYDGVNTYGRDSDKYVMTATPAAIALQLAKEISEVKEPFNKSIQFIFWDNEYESLKSGKQDGSYYFSVQEGKAVDMAFRHGYYYFDISYPGYKEDKDLNLKTIPAQLVDSNNYLMGLEIQERLRQLNVKFKRHFYDYNNSKSVSNMCWNSLTTVALGNSSTWGINTDQDNMKNVNINRMDEVGQIILDTLTMNKYMMKLK
ncbi:ABC transporter permease subunit [Clostridium culturomicium]|uniref:ABC transporter permease subunit n=1 Tax=Clostridium culturomicium TaxID=1499683 RepID=UPI0038572459